MPQGSPTTPPPPPVPWGQSASPPNTPMSWPSTAGLVLPTSAAATPDGTHAMEECRGQPVHHSACTIQPPMPHPSHGIGTIPPHPAPPRHYIECAKRSLLVLRNRKFRLLSASILRVASHEVACRDSFWNFILRLFQYLAVVASSASIPFLLAQFLSLFSCIKIAYPDSPFEPPLLDSDSSFDPPSANRLSRGEERDPSSQLRRGEVEGGEELPPSSSSIDADDIS
ncbi:hypothetical protein PIB30_076278 [Stylosanthes scabra]|uniref:Uncharacterized protein n=1 Tax=Stylosanthes scabra TaxID=79078 RepID=A0ABU6SQB2_9FABA|nr:hypothetical protein [Stylosanthes scabra]